MLAQLNYAKESKRAEKFGQKKGVVSGGEKKKEKETKREKEMVIRTS